MKTTSATKLCSRLGFLVAAALVSSAARADEKAVSDQEVRAVVDGHVGDLKGCMKDHGAATGKVVIEFSILPDGKATGTKVGQSSSNHALDQCIADRFSKWAFPKPRGGKAWLTAYPIIFSVPKEPPKGKLSEDEIVKTITGKMEEVKVCLAAAVKEKADVAGVADLGIVVSPAGAVTEVTVLKSTTAAPKLDACIVARVKTWQFPKPQGGGEASFRYPFKLNVK